MKEEIMEGQKEGAHCVVVSGVSAQIPAGLTVSSS